MQHDVDFSEPRNHHPILKNPLLDFLRLNGQPVRHSVLGSYAPDVAESASRIFSIKDGIPTLSRMRAPGFFKVPNGYCDTKSVLQSPPQNCERGCSPVAFYSLPHGIASSQSFLAAMKSKKNRGMITQTAPARTNEKIETPYTLGVIGVFS